MEGPQDTAFELGIKQLLCSDNKDENFWAYFSKFFDAEQESPLTFPIPSLEETAVSTATPTTQL